MDGLEHIRMLRTHLKQEAELNRLAKNKRLVGCFGIRGDRRDLLVGWVISNARKDKRHGPQGPPVSMSEMSKIYFNDMFRSW